MDKDNLKTPTSKQECVDLIFGMEDFVEGIQGYKLVETDVAVLREGFSKINDFLLNHRVDEVGMEEKIYLPA